MPRPRWDKLDDDKKRRILDAAEEAFAKSGLAGASYNQIIEAAGVSKGAMYYYFDDKDDLYVTVVNRALAPVAALSDVRFEADDIDGFWRGIEQLMMNFYAVIMANPARIELLRAAVLHIDREPLASHFLDPAVAHVLELAEQGRQLGAVRDDVPSELVVEILFGVGRSADAWLARNWDSFESGELDFAHMNAFMIETMRRFASPS